MMRLFERACGAGFHAGGAGATRIGHGLDGRVLQWSGSQYFHKKQVGAVAGNHQQGVLSNEAHSALPRDAFFQNWR